MQVKRRKKIPWTEEEFEKLIDFCVTNKRMLVNNVF